MSSKYAKFNTCVYECTCQGAGAAAITMVDENQTRCIDSFYITPELNNGGACRIEIYCELLDYPIIVTVNDETVIVPFNNDVVISRIHAFGVANDVVFVGYRYRG